MRRSVIYSVWKKSEISERQYSPSSLSAKIHFLDYVCENDVHFPMRKHYILFGKNLRQMVSQGNKWNKKRKEETEVGRKKASKKTRRKIIKGHNFPTETKFINL